MSEKVTEINKPEGNEMKLKLSKEYSQDLRFVYLLSFRLSVY